MSKTQEYIVLKPGVTVSPGGSELKVGSTVKLTDGQAASRVNKVQLKTEVLVAPESELAKRLSAAEEHIHGLAGDKECLLSDAAHAEIERKEAQTLNDELQATVGTLTSERDKASKALKAVTKERDDLVKAQVK